jgi:hypothetical protein
MCYTQSRQERLRALRVQRKLNSARLANYKTLYLAARAARDYLRDGSRTSGADIVAQLNAALIDPHTKQVKGGS